MKRRAVTLLAMIAFLSVGVSASLWGCGGQTDGGRVYVPALTPTASPAALHGLTATAIAFPQTATATLQTPTALPQAPTAASRTPTSAPQAPTAASRTPTVAPPSTKAPPSPPSFPYGVVYAYPKSEWTESDRQDVREYLEYLQGLGVNTIVQTFSSRLIGTGREAEWLILLDEAERLQMRVVARLWPANDWDGQNFDLRTVGRFLDVVQGHPALLAYLGLHEPLEQFNSDQLRTFYAGVQDIAPDLPIAHYMASMAWFDQNLRFPNRAFSAGICDICIIWYYPARYLQGEPILETDLVREILRENRRLVDERAPGTQLWFLGQVYAHSQHPRQLRMPTPQEMKEIFMITEQEGADGFLWYPWSHNLYDAVLSDPGMEPQRQMVREINESHVSERAHLEREKP